MDRKKECSGCKQMIRVLQCVNNMDRAGLETMLMNYYRNIDRTKIQFDFLMHRPDKSDYDDEIEKLGGRIYRAPRLYPQNYPAYFSFMRQFFRDHPEYQIMHSHIDAMSFLPLLAGKKAGIPIRIAHSHSTSIDRDFKYWLKQWYRHKIPSVSNYHFACGEKAGRFLFGDKVFRVIPNAVDRKQYLFDSEVRFRKREEFQLGERFVIGHVGRFSYPKNHTFLIRVFEQVLKREPDAVLLLIGTGEKESAIRVQVRQLGIEDRVLFLGSRSDVAELYQAMDVFVLPSLFEGIPVVGIEAQYAGVPCIFSDRVPDEVSFTEQCEFVDLNLPVDSWADKIMSYRYWKRGEQEVVGAQYDIQYACSVLEKLYLDLHQQTCSNKND